VEGLARGDARVHRVISVESSGARGGRWSPRLLRDAAQRRWLTGLLVIVAVAGLTRLLIILVTPHFTLWGDPVDYQRHAVSIATGHGFAPTTIATPGTPSAFRPPAYPVLLGGLYALLGVHPLAGRILSAALGVLAVALLAYLGRALWSPRVGLLAGAIGALFLPLIALNASLVSESLFIPIELAFALSLVGLARRPAQLRWALLAGVLCALAALTRAVADTWLLVAVAAILSAQQSGAARTRSTATLMIAFALVLTPWTIRNLNVFHAFVPVTTEAGFTVAGQYNAPTAAANNFQAVWRVPFVVPAIAARLRPLYRRRGGVDEVQLDAALRSIGLHYLERHPGDVAVASAFDTLRLIDLGPSHTYATGIADRELALPGALRPATSLSAQLVALLALLALGARARWRDRVRLGPWWLWALPLLTFALTVPMVGNPLKRVPLDPFLILLAAVAINSVASVRHRNPRIPLSTGSPLS
jgi:4-amino-4-deoxy-L-arabinose transferase-like glycosyltransferase